MDAPTFTSPLRSAHASIRGYVHQVCVSTLRWLRLSPQETLICEGDEDLDIRLKKSGLLIQVKHRSRPIGVPEVVETLCNFLRTYHARLKLGEERRFIFLTTAERRSSRKPELDILRNWNRGDRRALVVEETTRLVKERIAALRHPRQSPRSSKRRKRQRAPGASAKAPRLSATAQKEAVALEDALRFIQENARWDDFIAAVEWQFSQPSLEETRVAIRSELAARAVGIPVDLLEPRLIFEVLDSSSHRHPGLRVLDQSKLTTLLATTNEVLCAWAAGNLLAEQLRKSLEPVVIEIMSTREELRAAENLRRVLAPPAIDDPVSLGRLLRAENRSLSFQARSRELAELDRWHDAAGKAGVAIIAGEGGAGKTRLLLEWCQRLRERGEIAGFLDAFRAPSELDALFFGGGGARVMVVDYVEHRLDVAQRILAQLTKDSSPARPIRLVMLCRRVGDWVTDLRHRDANAGLVLDTAFTLLLPPLAVTLPDREAFFDTAVQEFAGVIPSFVRRVDSIQRPDLKAPHLALPLFLEMAAANALSNGAPCATAAALLDETVTHETRYWRNGIRAWRLDVPREHECYEVFRRAAAIITLWGGIPAADVMAVLDAVWQSDDSGRRLRSQLSQLADYFLSDGQGWVAGLQPDLLGETLATGVVMDVPGLIATAMDVSDEKRRESVLTVLNRATRHRSEARVLLGSALKGRLEPNLRLAIAVAVHNGGPIGKAVADEVSAVDDPALADRVRKACPVYTVSLLEASAVATEIALRHNESLGRSDPASRRLVAELANDLALRVRDLGKAEQALALSHRAVSLYAELVQEAGDGRAGGSCVGSDPALLSEYAASLTTRGRILGDAEEYQEALRVSQEGLQIRKALEAGHPGHYERDIAISLHNVGSAHGNLGQLGEARVANEEAVAIRRRILANSGGQGVSQLTASVELVDELACTTANMAAVEWRLGNRESSASWQHEALRLYGELSRVWPDRFLPALTSTYNNYSVMLLESGEVRKALAVVSRGAEVMRRCEREHPGAFADHLGSLLINVAEYRAALGDRKGAVKVAREAMDALQASGELLGIVRGSDMLGKVLSGIGERTTALEFSRKAVEVARQDAGVRGNSVTPTLARVLHNLGIRLEELGRCEEALMCIAESRSCYLRLPRGDRLEYTESYGKTLIEASAINGRLGRASVALRLARGAKRCWRYSKRLPADRREATARVLCNLCVRLRDVGRVPEAADAQRRGVAMWRELAAAEPAAFNPLLSGALSNLSLVLREMRSFEEAVDVAREGVEVLRRPFEEIPKAFALQMKTAVDDYLVASKDAERDADATLLMPLLAHLAALGVPGVTGEWRISRER